MRLIDVAPTSALPGFGLGVVIVPRLWRNGWKWVWSDDVTGGWPYGAALWRGFAR